MNGATYETRSSRDGREAQIALRRAGERYNIYRVLRLSVIIAVTAAVAPLRKCSASENARETARLLPQSKSVTQRGAPRQLMSLDVRSV